MTLIKNIYNNFMENSRFKHILKFGFVGCLNTFIDFGIFTILNSLFGINYIISQILSYSSGTLNSYICNKFWTFNDTRTTKKTLKEIIQFIIVNSASLAVSLLGLSILMKNNSVNAFLSKIISMALAQIVNFLGYRFFVFGSIILSKSRDKKIA